jgi:predicted restriction endonuclease
MVLAILMPRRLLGIPSRAIRVTARNNAVRSRDRRCVVSGKEAKRAQFNTWSGFEAAHIFPLGYKDHWDNHNYRRWISLRPETGGTINSVQNGLLLRSDIHQLFDCYAFSINPDVCISNLIFFMKL